MIRWGHHNVCSALFSGLSDVSASTHVFSVVGAGFVGALLMVLILGAVVLCYVCNERRELEDYRNKEKEILKRRSSSLRASSIRGQ